MRAIDVSRGLLKIRDMPLLPFKFDFCLYFAADFPGFSSASERRLVELRKQRIPFTLQLRTQMF